MTTTQLNKIALGIDALQIQLMRARKDLYEYNNSPATVSNDERYRSELETRIDGIEAQIDDLHTAITNQNERSAT